MAALAGNVGIAALGTYFVPEWMPDINADSYTDTTSPWALTQMLLTMLLVPLGEELVFRGALWSGFKKIKNNLWVPFIGTSILFVLAHSWAALSLGPLYVIAKVPATIILGLLRYYSDSIWPGVIAHITANSVIYLALLLLATLI